MAYINVDEVYILDNTGLQVDMATDIPFVDAGFTDAQKEQARKNIAAGGTNPNLLDNPFFQVNQRDVANGVVVNGNGFVADRWQATGTNGAYRNSDGTITVGTTLFHKIGDKGLVGKTVTFSILYVDGTVESKTIDYDGTSTYLLGFTNVGVSRIYTAANQINIGESAKNLKACKLEIGSVSTIANDAPPDYGEELRKCQRYLWVENIGANTPIASGVAFNTSSVFDFITPVPMRNGATIQITFNVTPYITYGTGNLALAGGTSSTTSGKNGNHLRVQIGTSADVGNLTEVHLLCGTDTVMTVSCEL